MYSEKFIEICSKMENKINSTPLELKAKEFDNLYNLITKLEIDSFNQFLINSGIKKDLDSWKKHSHDLYKNISSIGILPLENKIQVVLNDEVIKEDLVSLDDYLSNLSINKNNWEYKLAQAVFIQPQNFEFFQVVNAFLLK